MISLAKTYYLVTNDRFELFYRSIIKSYRPYYYYIKATCIKGYTYNRYFTFTPNDNEIGSYELTIGIYDEEGKVIEEAKTTLVVNKPCEVEPTNIMCIGDSLTCNGVWPYVGYQKYNEFFPNKLNFIGKMRKEEIGYEGYGGWQWKTFVTEYNYSVTSCVWVNCQHHLDEKDQHSIWMTNELEWILETIEKDRLKFKRGTDNNKVNPELGKILSHKQHGEHCDDIIINSYEYSEGNPFYNFDKKEVDFDYYLKKNNFATPDLIFILLTWNGQYIPYNNDFTIHNENAQIIIRKIHKAMPKAKIGLLGIQLPCPNGGITACYGASGYYHDWYGDTITAFNYNEWLEQLTFREEYRDYVYYFDTKAQFDSENSYATKLTPLNNRTNEMEKLGVNGIHPSMNGYLQIGDSFYRALIQMLNKNEQKDE